MRREQRLRASSDFRRVRSQGRSWAHPLIVLYAADHPEGPDATTRIGFVAGKRVGKAVVRNRAKRRVREAVRLGYGTIPSGKDLIFTVRPGGATADYDQLQSAVHQLLKRAGLKIASEEASCAASCSP